MTDTEKVVDTTEELNEEPVEEIDVSEDGKEVVENPVENVDNSAISVDTEYERLVNEIKLLREELSKIYQSSNDIPDADPVEAYLNSERSISYRLFNSGKGEK